MSIVSQFQSRVSITTNDLLFDGCENQFSSSSTIASKSLPAPFEKDLARSEV